MLKYLDTSIILESIIKDAKYSIECAQIIQAIKKAEEQVILTTLNIGELFHILLNREGFTINYINDYIEALIKLEGVQLIEISKGILFQAFILSKKYQIDLADASAIILMQKHQIKSIYSLDSNYDKFRDIQRLTHLPG